jgi:NAD dependent epimerase/dehydratase family enzyme
MADLLLTGRRVLPAHAEEIGFEFQYPTLESCLQNIIRRRLKSA